MIVRTSTKTAQQVQGQFMTPPEIARLMVKQLRPETDMIVDFAAGDGSLLSAAEGRFPFASLLGSEIDGAMIKNGGKELSAVAWRLGDGLKDKRLETRKVKSIGVLCNPPYAEFRQETPPEGLLLKAFPGLTTLHGRRRKEFYFLAKALLIARRFGGIVSILMPIGFADGDYFKQYRQILMDNYCVTHAIELPSNIFPGTEVRTILIRVDAAKAKTNYVQISRYLSQGSLLKPIVRKRLISGERMDAKYHLGRRMIPSGTIAIRELGVSITRGTFSRKEADTHKIRAIHTSDLSRTENGELLLPRTRKLMKKCALNLVPVYAEPGDILISRTGSRVSWRPVVLRSGIAPITDHVFRIRSPKEYVDLIKEAFFHPNFPKWVEMNIKGACASILTKSELLNLPVFDYSRG